MDMDLGSFGPGSPSFTSSTRLSKFSKTPKLPRLLTPSKRIGSTIPDFSCSRTSLTMVSAASSVLRMSSFMGRKDGFFEMVAKSPLPGPRQRRSMVMVSRCTVCAQAHNSEKSLAFQGALCHRGSWAASVPKAAASTRLRSTSSVRRVVAAKAASSPNAKAPPPSRKARRLPKELSMAPRSFRRAIAEAGSLRKRRSTKEMTAKA
mmetsp:Transcript_65912/g.141046  ORF Transcript_65912/g.141046 Transcript_65912/m.141046 type:complete len:205 (+) Transcript_65912:197-811(+)